MPRTRSLQRFGVLAIVIGGLVGVTGVVHAQNPVTATQTPAQTQQPAQQQAANDVTACRLTMPANALSAQGLAAPWVLSGARGGQCDETVKPQAAFIDATIFDPATSTVSIYRPLIINRGTTPAIDPLVPTLPANAVVEISVGFNGDQLFLADANGGTDIAAANCVNGLPGSIFGQEIFCNAPAFYAAANGKVAFPGRANSPDDGMPCPTTESWEIVDQEPRRSATAATTTS